MRAPAETQHAAPPRPATGVARRGLAAGLAALATLTAMTLAAAAIGGWYEPASIVRTDGQASPSLERELARLTPTSTFVIVDTYDNRLRLYRDGELEREMVCSTGSGVELRDPRTGFLWHFDTPRGERRVERKSRKPVWIKPDWAFLEVGQEPPARAADRIDRVSLGDYGIYLGDGYIIHGTLFQSLLGQRLTHGCIRLGDEDLAYLYRRVVRGTRVYLY